MRRRGGRQAGALEWELGGGSRHGDAGAHEAAAVDDDPDGLAALGLILAGDEGAAAGGGGPADVAEVVAFAVFAEGFEVAAETALTGLAELEVDLAAPGEEDLLFLAGAQGGVDADGLGEGREGPALGEAEGGSIAYVEASGFGVAALLRTV